MKAIPGIKKKIIIDSCIECPLNENCKQFKKLSSKAKVVSFLSPQIPKYILSTCPLEDYES